MNTLLKIKILRGSSYSDKIARRTLKDLTNYINLPDAYLLKNCGVNRVLFHQILTVLEPVVPKTQRSNSIPFPLKVLVTLSFLTSGLHQKLIGRDFSIDISQKSVSRVIKIIIEGLNVLLNNWVVFPATPAQREQIKEGYVWRRRRPRLLALVCGRTNLLGKAPLTSALATLNRIAQDLDIFYCSLSEFTKIALYILSYGTFGCLNGTYVEIVCPRDDEEAFYDCKGQYSLHAQIMCDADSRIIAICCRFGGAASNAYIWSKSNIQPFIENIYRQGESGWLIADNKYPQRAWLMTPILHASQGTPESQYNHFHGRTKTCIDRCISKLKGRWRCLHQRPLHYTPQRAAKIINACAVLHNLCIMADLPDPELYVDPEPMPMLNEGTEMPDDNVNRF